VSPANLIHFAPDGPGCLGALVTQAALPSSLLAGGLECDLNVGADPGCRETEQLGRGVVPGHRRNAGVQRIRGGDQAPVVLGKRHGHGLPVSGECHFTGGQEEGLRAGAAGLDDPPGCVDSEVLGTCRPNARRGMEASRELGVGVGLAGRRVTGELRPPPESAELIATKRAVVAIERHTNLPHLERAVVAVRGGGCIAYSKDRERDASGDSHRNERSPQSIVHADSPFCSAQSSLRCGQSMSPGFNPPPGRTIVRPTRRCQGPRPRTESQAQICTRAERDRSAPDRSHRFPRQARNRPGRKRPDHSDVL